MRASLEGIHPKGAPTGDWDLDGFQNRDEFVAGTNPDDPDDWFRVRILSVGPTGQRVEVFGVAGDIQYGVEDRFYAIEQSPGVPAAAWLGVPGFTNVRGTAAAIWYTNDAGASSNRFFRGRVWIVP